ncbi:hypothetical protein [uncultured Tateyamaria sp.]|uniref:hypothetical protein n=1 Tax=uncultured Tateyamaria sp. TaxID=455651 RepID=UPI0026300D4B|nr:hypothetical protein [uncultured Tateyamaria sp.]
MPSFVLLLLAIAIPVIVELKVFDAAVEGRDHVLNILKRVAVTFVILWCIGMAEAWMFGLSLHPFGPAVHFAILASVLALPLSFAGYFLGRRKE